MLGYVIINKDELKVREFDLYKAYYCGVCKSIGSRLGQVPRMALSYDSVFLALVLSGLDGGPDVVDHEHCVMHHVQKRGVAKGDPAIDYAADVMVILAYHKFLDDWHDDKSFVGLSGKTALTSAYNKAAARLPKVTEGVKNGLDKLSALENEKSGNIDLLNDAFADIMEALFTGYSGADTFDEGTLRTLAQLGRNLGKWIYTIDAVDDLEKDKETGSYNPFIYRKGGADGADFLLYDYLAGAANASDLLDIKKNRNIIDNIIYMGLRGRTDAALGKGNERNDEQSL